MERTDDVNVKQVPPPPVILITLIIKITISSIVIGLKNTYCPLIHLLRCY